MKNKINANIEGRGFLKPFLLFFIPIVILSVVSERTNQSSPLVSTVLSLGESYLSLLLSFAFITYATGFISFREKRLQFGGQWGEFAPRVLKWFLLTAITLGIYSPWMLRNLADYYLSRTEYEGKRGEFLSRPGTLLKYMLLTLYLPMIILCSLFGFYIYRTYYSGVGVLEWQSLIGPTIGFTIILLLASLPFTYFYVSWFINFRFGDRYVRFEKSMSEMIGFLLPQILLSLVTVGVYWPAALIKTCGFFVNGSSHASQSGAGRRAFSFDRKASEGFGFIWGQLLLAIITIGIYGPWAWAKVSNWFLNGTSIETSETGAFN